jgi:hypothetical protein
MGRKKSNFSKSAPALDLGVQRFHLARAFASFKYSREGGEAVWQGKLQPRETSPTYRLVIRYRVGKTPKVKVISPALAKGCPHLYKDGSLCLFWPVEWRWQDSQLIAETILPWAASWLVYYELWLDTGEWLGPSSHDASVGTAENGSTKKTLDKT